MSITATRRFISTMIILLLPLAGSGNGALRSDASDEAKTQRKKSQSSPRDSQKQVKPKRDYANWVWIHTRDGKYRFAIPPGAWNYLNLDKTPLKSTTKKPYVTGGLLRIVTPQGEHLMFQTVKSSKNLGDRFDRQFVRGTLFGPLGAQSVSEAKVLKQSVGTAAEFIAKCRNSPFPFQEGKSFTAVVRIIQAGGTDYVFTIVSQDAKQDKKRVQQILDSFQRVSRAKASPKKNADSQ